VSLNVSGYRVRRGVKLPALIDRWQPIVRASVIKAIRNQYFRQAEAVKSDDPRLLEALIKSDNETIARLRIAHEEMEAGIRETFIKHRHWGDPFDFHASVTFRFYKNRIYVQTFEGSAVSDCWDFLKKDRRLEEFGATNSSDYQESTIGRRAWRHRLKVWDAIYENEGRLRYLSLPILDDFLDARRILHILATEFAELHGHTSG
jgi:hypothetical protein